MPAKPMTEEIPSSDTLQSYGDFRPTGFDSAGLGLDDRQAWFVAPCSHNRDSGILATCNWEAQLRVIKAADPSGEDYEAHSFGHWGCGWFKIMIVRPGSAAQLAAEGIACALSSYPILDDSAFSEAEDQAVCEQWASMDLRERIALCSERGVSIFAARHDSIPEEVYDRLRDRLDL